MAYRFSNKIVSTLVCAMLTTAASAASSHPTAPAVKKPTPKVAESLSAKRKLAKRSKTRHHYYEHFYTSSYADDNTLGDITAGEDPVVRAAAIDALGNMNGTIVAINPDNGR